MFNYNVNIFQMKSKPHGIERLNEFINTNENGLSFVAIGWPGIGDLTNKSKKEIRDLLIEKYEYEGQQLANYLGAVNAFVNTVKNEDLVLISNNLDQVFVFEVGDYKYVKEYDNDIDGMCHQREANLLVILNKSDLVPELQELLRNRGTITQFKYPFEKSGLDKWLEPDNSALNFKLDDLINKSLSTLEKELLSDDAMVRINAAKEILRYAAKKSK